jgi:uncharacterized membrane protein YdfJ with MMPL/SSD domain
LAVAVFVAVAVIGSGAPGSFSASRAFNDPGAESTHARDQIEVASGESAEPNVIALVDAPPGSAKVEKVIGQLEGDPGIATVTRPPARGLSPLFSRDGGSVIVPAAVKASVSNDATVERLLDTLGDEPGVELGGNSVAGVQVGEQATSDLATAELLAFPLLALLMFLFFRGIAALLPLAVGATTVFGTFAILRTVNQFLSISPFALNLVIGLGLGLAIDYSLLWVSRYREELGRGASAAEALRGTMGRSGHTVLFSALTVAAALACLVLFPQRFLISMGIGGALVALIAAAATFLVLPPTLILLAPRLGKVRPKPAEDGRWCRLCKSVMRRPLLVAVAAAALMLVLASPILHLNWTGVDATSLPNGQSARTVFEEVEEGFPEAGSSPVLVAVDAPATSKPEVAAFAAKLGQLDGALGAPSRRYLGADVWKIEVETSAAPGSDEGQALVERARAVPAPFPTAVGGAAAELEDSQAAVADALPLALVVLLGLTLAALWLMTASVVLPVKALLMNFLTLAAATGIVVFVFQDGHLNGLLGADQQNGIEQTDYLVLAAIVFGLSTDYGVFLLSRIKEERDRIGSDREAIATGLQRTGAVVSAAAVLLAVALGAFVTSGLVFLKELGLGAACAVLLDAFVVRTLLVPSLMALLGEFNWWQPQPLRAVHRRLGIAATPPAEQSSG